MTTRVRCPVWGAVLAAVVLAAVPALAQPSGVTDAEIVLGASTALSGPLAFPGEQVTRYGVDLYFREVNARGGIHGRTVRTIYRDDGSRPEDALANTRGLVEQDGVFAVIAPQGTAPVAATLEYLESRRVPLLFPFQGAAITRGRAWVFSGMTLYDRQSRLMIEHLAGTRKARTYAALYQDDEYGRTFLGLLRQELARHRLALGAAEPVKRGAADLSAPMARLRAAKPEVVFVVLTPGPASQALKERQKIGWADVLLVSTGPLTDERYLALAGEAAEGVEGLSLWPDALTSTLPGVVAHRAAMQKHFGKNEPNRYSLSGYFAAMLFTEAARRAGRALTRESLVAALESVKDWDSGILPPVTIGPEHETQKHGLWIRMERGRFRPLTGWLPSG